MAKFYGTIGFALAIEDPPDSGKWVESIVEKRYYGDVLRNSVHNENGEGLNRNINISNELSIVADSFMLENSASMRYVEWIGARWEIRTISMDYPRITLSIGGVYNGRHGPSTVPSQPPEGDSVSE